MTTLKTRKNGCIADYAQSSMRQCLLFVVFANVFYLQTESIQKPLEITSEKVLESSLRRETIKSPKSSF